MTHADHARALPTRRPDLDIHAVADGYIVYDRQSDRIHYLNHTAALILELCGGVLDDLAIARLVQEAFDLESSVLDHTKEAIRKFDHEGLLVTNAESQEPRTGSG